MQDSDFFLLQELYTNHLTALEDINFTRREIDVMACLLHARGTSKISDILDISPHTVVTHVRKIMSKLNCSSRESIIDFVERSKKSGTFKKYYTCLVLLRDFEKSLKEISRLNERKSPVCLLICGNYQRYTKAFFQHLENHLKQAGIEVAIHEQDLAYNPTILSNKVLLSFVKTEDLHRVSKNFATFDSIELGEETNYYFYVFAILEKLFLDKTLDSIIAEFKKIYEGIEHPIETPLDEPSSFALLPEKTVKPLWHQTLPFVQSKVVYDGIAIFFLIFAGIGYIHYFTHNDFIRSEIILPIDSLLLHRSEIIAKIDKGFRSNQGIQAIALAGPGGAGKTTLARQYAQVQKANVLWEINAETHESLKSAFESLAKTLSKTKEDKKILTEIEELKDSLVRENKILDFVKERLRISSNWFLIFDNMEKFLDIQNYFPHDPKTWGQGKIILTTRDTNIQNNKHINSTIQIGELTPLEKLKLFSSIMNGGKSSNFSPAEEATVKNFLEKIPPYPLDISVAAYYLKSTHIPYSGYLDMLINDSQDISKVQENLLKEAGHYTKTRYAIVSLSMKHLINTHPDFRDLLFFISLINSQNISRDLLRSQKQIHIIDDFIYHLKKYSLITSETSHPLIGPMFSLHRSTQEIMLLNFSHLLKSENKDLNSKNISDNFYNYIVNIVDNYGDSQRQSLVSHCKSFVSHNDFLSDNEKSTIEGELGIIYFLLSELQASKEMLLKSYSKLKKICNNPPLGIKADVSTLPPKQEFESVTKNSCRWTDEQCADKTARVTLYLGNSFRDDGDYKYAKYYIKKSLEMYKKDTYKNHVKIGLAKAFLAIIYREEANYKEAKNLLGESIAILTKYKDTPELARSLAYLGIVYTDMGDYKNALHYLEKSYEILKNNPLNSAYNGHSTWVLLYLGNVYRILGRYDKAKILINQAILIYQTQFPENRLKTAFADLYLGILYEDLDEFKKAKDILEKSLAVHRRNLKSDHFKIALILMHLGNVYGASGNVEKAIEVLQESFSIYEKKFGKQSPDVALVLGNLGKIYIRKGDLAEAEILLTKAFSIFQDKKNPKLRLILENLAELSLEKSRFKENEGNKEQAQIFKEHARAYVQQALEVAKEHFPIESPHIKRIQDKLNTF